jgi:hypothetical protein
VFKATLIFFTFTASNTTSVATAHAETDPALCSHYPRRVWIFNIHAIAA